MEALNHGNHLRHTADIAFAHLLHLAEIGEINAETIFAMPSSYNHQQLAILLGIAKQSPIEPVGVVDTAVLAAVASLPGTDAQHDDGQGWQLSVRKLCGVRSAVCISGDRHLQRVADDQRVSSGQGRQATGAAHAHGREV